MVIRVSPKDLLWRDAINTLIQLGDKRVVHSLIPVLGDEHPGMRKQAALGLTEIGYVNAEMNKEILQNFPELESYFTN